jgi:hypothetical protein
MLVRFPIIRSASARCEEFVRFWSACYEGTNEQLYSDSIGRQLTPDRVRSLYLWKNGGQRLAEQKRRSVERNVIGRLGELRALDENCPPADFLRRFGRVGPIWSIFLLHIWQPDAYPIHDQHTHRAMRFIQTLPPQIEEIPMSACLKVQTYLGDCVPFFSGRFPAMPDRRVDKALSAFGKFLKTRYGPQLALQG